MPEIMYRQQLDPLTVKKIEHTFLNYSDSFLKADTTFDKHINLKKEHTLRVCNEIRELGRAEHAQAGERAFLEALALLHDIGRFRQFSVYGTFADAESENHSVIALHVIRELKLHEHFSEHQMKIIDAAILNHNIPQLESGLNEEILYYSKLLRDADKLDIWRVTVEHNIFHKLKNETFPDVYSVPHTLLDRFAQNRIILLNQVDSFYDSLLFRISWVFDLNFNYTLKQFTERNIAGKLARKLPSSPELEQIIRYVEAYVNNRLS